MLVSQTVSDHISHPPLITNFQFLPETQLNSDTKTCFHITKPLISLKFINMSFEIAQVKHLGDISSISS